MHLEYNRLKPAYKVKQLPYIPVVAQLLSA